VAFWPFLTTATREKATKQSSLEFTHAIVNDGMSDVLSRFV